jgi:hypothetical protein
LFHDIEDAFKSDQTSLLGRDCALYQSYRHRDQCIDLLAGILNTVLNIFCQGTDRLERGAAAIPNADHRPVRLFIHAWNDGQIDFVVIANDSKNDRLVDVFHNYGREVVDVYQRLPGDCDQHIAHLHASLLGRAAFNNLGNENFL